MTLALVQRADERLSALERLEVLCDPGSLQLMRTQVRSRRMGEKARAGDGVIAGSGRVDGRPVFCYAQDPTYLGGSLGEQHADSIVRVLRLAGRAGAPVVGFIESGGARMQEGLAALAGYARIRDRLPVGLLLGGRLARACDALASVALCKGRNEEDTADHQQHRDDGGRGGEQQGPEIALRSCD